MTTPSRLIFLDANVPMYAGGRPHALKQPSIDVLALAADSPYRFVTDAEVLQEILHRYLAIGRWQEGRLLFDQFAQLMEARVEPITVADARLTADLVEEHSRLNARDLLHLAVMRRVGATHIVTADRGFDAIVDIVRLDPADVGVWRGLIDSPAS